MVKHVNVIELCGDVRLQWKCVGGGGGWRLSRQEAKVCLSPPAVCLAKERRCRDSNGLSMREGGEGEGGREKREGRAGSEGFTARSLEFQVMDMLELVLTKPAVFLPAWER